MPGKPNNARTIKVNMMARVEGEGALHVTVCDQEVQDVQLRIFEPPRFFEAFLQGRHFSEVPDIVARICGICPVAYQMSAVHALEPIFGIQIPQSIQLLRRLLYCAEWIESHVLHIYMLHAPDFLGYESGIEMAKDYPDIVKRGLRLKKVGNQLLTLLGGRSVHPVSVKVGGFSRVPSKRELETLIDDLLWARDAAVETIRWTTGFEFSDPEQDYTFVALRSATEYPMNDGLVASNRGLEIPAVDFEQYFQEKQVTYSNALHCLLNGQSYLAGPLARLHLNYEQLSPLVKDVLSTTGLSLPFKRVSQGIVARSLEVLHAIDEALDIIQQYEAPNDAAVSVTPRAGISMAVTEAPRGLLYHRYQVNEDGTIQAVKIVPPTSQNQRQIEEDLRAFLPHVLDRPDEEVALGCEKIVRSYDPCISCATHFLTLHIHKLPA
ncbi:MAG: Ni/Fe hydrogenase subunit alpha [Nitrospirales bacterium]|nr:Ni/Fe hydrogenase subunit alpha [Nitrospirales bacterium]